MKFKITQIVCGIFMSFMAMGISSASTIDFSGWDPSVLSTDGGTQTFNNGDLEVTVTSFGDFDAPTEYIDTVGGAVIASQHDGDSPPSDHGFEFCFNQQTPVTIEFQLLDALEEYEITTTGTASYEHVLGTMPDVSTTATGALFIDGAGFGLGATGASNGLIHVAAPDSGPFCLSVTYRADSQFGSKYGSFRLNQVPEPASAGTLYLGLLGMVGLLRKRRR